VRERFTTIILLLSAPALLQAVRAGAEVVGVEITSRKPFADGMAFGSVGSYEVMTGRLHYAVDPGKPANARIVDLRYAPRDAAGRVVFAGDFLVLKPVDLARGNHRLFYDVNNRGNLVALGLFNQGERTNRPGTAADAGNGFLMREGYTVAWSGWNWDVANGDNRLQIDLPIATNAGRPITGTVVAEIVVSERSDTEPFAWGDSRGYPVVDAADNAGATLTVRDTQTAPRVQVPRSSWRFADETHVRLPGGFAPGRIYELVYEARDPRVVGLGLTAIRDTLSFLRFARADAAGVPNPLARRSGDGALRPDPEEVLIFGMSQSGRVIQHMLLLGLHADERRRMVFDGALVHVPGAGKGSFNHRFAQTTRHPSQHEDHQYPTDFFPFGTTPATDPVTGETGDVLEPARALGLVPRIFYTSSSTEYWTRSASLLHTDVTGTHDATLDERVRLYSMAGAQHGAAGPRSRGIYENPRNPLDYSPLLRALLKAMDRWVSTGAAPPPSRYPRIDKGELVTVAAYREHFPKVPDLRLPTANLQPPRLDLGPRFKAEGIVDRQPPAFGPPYVTLVPDPDSYGIDRAGVRLPEVEVPLGTYTGWNLRRAEVGAVDALARWAGSFLPFASTEEERIHAGDPRPSLEALYPSPAVYVERLVTTAERLRSEGLLLDEDAAAYADRAQRQAWPPAR
jgi:hypothetical protein